MKNVLMFPCVYGVMAITKNKNVAVLVQNNGRICIDCLKNRKKLSFVNKFLVRGVLFFILGIYYTICGLFQFNAPNAEQSVGVEKVSKSLNVSYYNVLSFVVLCLSVVLSVFVFGILPIKISYFLSPKNFDVLVKRLIIAFIKIVFVYLLLLALKFVPPFKKYYMFNSALKKSQTEKNEPNFLFYFIFNMFICTFVLSLIGITINKWYSIFINIFITIVLSSINFEILSELQKVKWAKWILSPIYYLICQNPSHLEKKCVNILLSELELSSSKRDKMQEEIKSDNMPFSEAYVLAKEILEKANKFEKSDLDFIFAEVLNLNRAQVKILKNISKSDFNKVKKIATRRAGGEPLSKIFGHANFYGLDFDVTSAVLSPRMDTERLVETVLADLKPKQTVLDVGTGSGAIAITIAKNSNTKVTAVDVSDEALKIARKNATKNNVKVNFVKSDLFDALGRFSKFDVIVSNPPYIPTNQLEGLDEEVKHFDPIIALDGGENGLRFYEKIIDQAPKRLNKNGKIYFEVGKGQAIIVKKLLQKNFKDIRIVKDYNKIDRVVCATLI